MFKIRKRKKEDKEIQKENIKLKNKIAESTLIQARKDKEIIELIKKLEEKQTKKEDKEIETKEIKNIETEFLYKKMKEAGIEPNMSLIENSFVSIPTNDKNKMFEEFLKILELFINDENSFKTGRLNKDGTQNFPTAVCETIKNKAEIEKKAKNNKEKTRYALHGEFMKNFHISNSIQDIKNKQSKAEFFRDISTAFTQYKSWLMVQEAKHSNPEAEEEEPSEKLKSGIFG